MNGLIHFYQMYAEYVRKQRRGQALMNALYAADHELFERIENTEADCFYDDRKIPAFRAAVGLSESQMLGLPTTTNKEEK